MARGGISTCTCSLKRNFSEAALPFRNRSYVSSSCTSLNFRLQVSFGVSTDTSEKLDSLGEQPQQEKVASAVGMAHECLAGGAIKGLAGIMSLFSLEK